VIHHFSHFHQKKYFYSVLNNYFHLFLFAAIAFLNSCSPSERFTKKDETTPTTKTTTTTEATSTAASEIRVLLNELKQSEIITVDSPAILSDNSKKIIQLDSGARILCFTDDISINLKIDNKSYTSVKFFLSPVYNGDKIKINGKMYRGKIQISYTEGTIHLINILGLEDYVKGVLAKEMPSGSNDYLEALKALAVCIRTYAIKKMQDGKIYFDLFADTRDQVYGGVEAENDLSNQAVEETKNLVLKYENSIATLYYHSTCGGYTESSENVFTEDPLPYLKSIKDGDEPFCKISPRFQWKEIYSREKIIQRLKDYSLLDNKNYQLKAFSILSKNKSGRVSELEIKVTDTDKKEEKTLVIRGNEIRSILKTSDNKNILWSTMFDVSENSDSIILTGKGFGHGVGLCQWGAIAMSRQGYNYKNILQHYYTGTTISKNND
jgi:stage II sporulation protein D